MRRELGGKGGLLSCLQYDLITGVGKRVNSDCGDER